jgi:hypothetical protein
LSRGAGLEQDVDFLATVPDPRALDGSGGPCRAAPFTKAGFPEAGAGLSDHLRGWWAYSKTRVRWNAALDRFEEK